MLVDLDIQVRQEKLEDPVRCSLTRLLCSLLLGMQSGPTR